MALQWDSPALGGGPDLTRPAGQPSLQFSVPCLEVVDEDGKPPSFNYLFYELPLPEFPFKVNFYVANGWCNGQGNFVQSMKLLNADKTQAMVETGDQPFKLENKSTPFMAVNFFQEIPFMQAGTFWFQVFLNGKQVLEYPLTVRQAEKK